jgi:hypothetical protein
MATTGGIFCLEGTWADHRELADRTSVVHQLRMFEDARACGKVIHRDVATRGEFDYYVREWPLKETYRREYPLAYLAFHGARGALWIGPESEPMTLEELKTTIGPGRAHNRILYFGSCSTMAANEDELQGFCKETGAKAIVGFTNNINWLESAAFDCLLVPKLLAMKNMRSVYTKLQREHPKFVQRLGLRMATSEWATVP